MIKTSKSISVILLLIISGFIIFYQPAKATVPVQVMGGILDLVKKVDTIGVLKDIDDTDWTPDLNNYIFGEFYPELVDKNDSVLGKLYGGNVGVSRTQKLIETDGSGLGGIEDTLNDIIQNIARRMEEVQGLESESIEISCNCDNSDPRNKSCELIGNADLNQCDSGSEREQEECADAINELGSLAFRVCEYKQATRETTALDVHIVKDTTDTIEEFRNVAKEQLARKQIGQLSKQMMDAYDTAGIKYTDNPDTPKSPQISNYKDFLTEEPKNRAKDFLKNKYFAEDRFAPGTDKASIQSAVEATVDGAYRNQDSFQKLDAPTNEVFDSGNWDNFIQLLDNNDYSYYFDALEAAREVENEAIAENEAINIAGQGAMPQTKQITDEAGNPIMGLDGSMLYTIITPAGEVSAWPAIIAEAQFDRAGNPLSASVEKETISTPDRPLLEPIKDTITSKAGKIGNVEWQIKQVKSAGQAMKDILEACFPDLPTFDDIFPDFDDIFPEIPTGSEICGQFFDICSYFPDICDFSSLPADILDLLEGTIKGKFKNIWDDFWPL